MLLRAPLWLSDGTLNSTFDLLCTLRQLITGCIERYVAVMCTQVSTRNLHVPRTSVHRKDSNTLPQIHKHLGDSVLDMYTVVRVLKRCRWAVLWACSLQTSALGLVTCCTPWRSFIGATVHEINETYEWTMGTLRDSFTSVRRASWW